MGGVLTGLGGSENDWTPHQCRLTAQSGRNLLTFASPGNRGGLGGNLDHVSLNRVPEPGGLALTPAALSGMLLLPRRRRRQAEQRRAVGLASSLKRDA